ncbi:MAG: tetratricopeptide repeat protein [Candidatus Aminicenantes bacterium]|nr:tetratricopeptide repeat protein [Candidatus Aminicenantes bacterium]
MTDLSQGITPRWKAMQQFIEGLRLFRETQRTEEKRKLYLIKAKDAFSMAVRDDEKFVQCYNNFGYIYRKLKSDEAAEAAFREALKKKPDYHHCYYQLAEIYCENYYKGKKGDKLQKEYSLSDAQWFCQQAVTIFPSEPSYWDLLAGICYYKRGKPDEEVINSSMTGTMLAWRALCKSIIKGEKTSKYKDTALSCIRNLAVLTGWKGKWSMWSSRCLFGQAIFLNPDNNDLHFMRGKSFYRLCKTDGKSGIHEGENPHSQMDNNNKVEIDTKNAQKACNAFKRVFEDDVDVNDPFSFWAFYINVNAKLYEKKKENEYLDVVNDGYSHFLDAAAEIIHKDKSYQDEMIKRIEGLVSEALELTKVDRNAKKHKKDKDVIVSVAQKPMEEDNKARRNGLLYELRKLMHSNRDIVKWKKETSQLINSFNKQIKSDSFTWMNIQIDIKSALLLLQTRRKPSCYKAKEKLESAINKLKVKYPNELKILGLYMHLATAYLLLGSYDEALKASRQAVRLNPYDSEIRKVLGEVYFNLKDYSQAIHELQICFHLDKPELNILQKNEILEKIGEAYIKEGKILRDPDKRKKSFEEAAKFFKESHDIIEDKSYDKATQEYKSYIETLDRTHFNLASFYYELLKYDEAISHYQSALEMAKALKSNVDILETLLRMGWVYLEIQTFAEAEKTFKEAESYQDASPLAKAEIAIGFMFSKVERAISIGKNILTEDDKSKDTLKNIKNLVDKEINDIEENAKKELDNIIAQKPLDDTQKNEKIQKVEIKKDRLSALYHECLGRYYFKQEKRDEAKEEFEKSISFMPNPRVYLYLTEFYLHEASESRIGRKEMLMAKARNACKLCRKNDLRLQYKQDVDDLEKKLEAREK